MWISVLWHSRFHCPGIVLLGTQKYDIEAYTGTILNFFHQKYILRPSTNNNPDLGHMTLSINKEFITPGKIGSEV